MRQPTSRLPSLSAGAFDVVGRDGRLARRIRIPGNVRVVAVTDDHAYLDRKDEVDLEWLERYPLD